MESPILHWLVSATSAIALLLPILVKMWLTIQKLKQEYGAVWSGIVMRGFIEVSKMGLMEFQTNEHGASITVDRHALIVFEPLKNDLRQLHETLKARTGREPTDPVLAWEIEKEFQSYMLRNVCPHLGISQHGCLAIACVIARGLTNGVHP